MTSTTAFAAPTAPAAPGPFRITRKDVALAAGVGVAQVGLTLAASFHQSVRRPLDWWAITLLAIGPAALLLRRRFPVTVLWVVLFSTAAFWAADYRRGPIFLGLVVAFGNVMLLGRRREGWISLGLGWAIFTWDRSAFGWEPAPSIAEVLGLAAWLLILGGGMELFRARRMQMVGIAQARAEEARRQQSEERLRIAREVHDVVAHNVSLINVQAGVALHLIEEQPERAGPALAAIKQASKETLDELRSVVDALRGVDESAPRAPTPGIDDIDRLVARTTDAGLPVRLIETGLRGPLPAGVDLAAYRIVQEALTNATRHARASCVVVQLERGETDLTVTVEDDGRAGSDHNFWSGLGDAYGVHHIDAADRPNGGGAGIKGMRERATALGGTFEAGPLPTHGFRVRATFPIDRDQ